MGLHNLELIFDNPQRIYFSRQTVTGRLVVQTDAPKNLRSIIIKFKGEANVHWTETRHERRNGKTHTRHVSFNGHEHYFDSSIKVFGSGAGTETLPTGEHTYPFSMVLPGNLPLSFEGEHGYIRYTVKATLDRPWKFDHDVKAAFTVLSHVDLNLDPVIREPTKRENTKQFCCCCCKSGPLTVVTILPARGFVSGQRVPVTVEVDNCSNVNIHQVVIELQKLIKFHATSPPKTRSHHVTVQKVVLEGAVRENDSRTWAQTFTVPPLPPSQLRECRIIDLEYVIKVKAKPEGMHKDLVNEIPITIGTIPLWEGQPMPSNVPIPGAAWSGPDSSSMPMPMPMPSAPPPDMYAENPTAPYPNMPPPSYEECTFGTTSIGDSEDGQHVFGITSYNPRYPTYNLPAPPPAYPGFAPPLPESLPPKY